MINELWITDKYSRTKTTHGKIDFEIIKLFRTWEELFAQLYLVKNTPNRFDLTSFYEELDNFCKL